MTITDEQMKAVVQYLENKQKASQEVEQILTKYNMTAKELLIAVWHLVNK
jgi:hypothetical protein